MMTNREPIKLSEQPINILIGNLYDYGCDARYKGQWEATLWEIERRLTLLYTPKKKHSKIRLEHKIVEESNGNIFEDIINDSLVHGWYIVDTNAKFIPNQGLIFTARLEKIVEVNDE